MLQADYQSPNPTKRAGGRIASDAYRNSLSKCEDFSGLEEGINRYDLLLLVKKVGRVAGFTPRMIELLDYYMAFTRDVDWEEGSWPIVYQSISRTALDLGVSERQIQKLENALFKAGAITWNDSGNHKRFGQRDPVTGRIQWAFGVELTPLAYLREELEQKLHEKQLYDQAWLKTKRQISWYRRQICAMLDEWNQDQSNSAGTLRSFEQQYAEIAIKLRTHLDLEMLRSLLVRHKSLHAALKAEVRAESGQATKAAQQPSLPKGTCNGSPKGERTFVHYKSTTQELFDKSNTRSPADEGFQESVAADSELPNPRWSSGLAHVTLGMAIEAASERLTQWLPQNPTWHDFADAAHRHRAHLAISQKSWADACELLGPSGAALCLLVTDRATERLDDPIRVPAAYFRGMVNRARAGELRLHNSIFGLLAAPDGPEASNAHSMKPRLPAPQR